jgi:hypothetical protein
MRKRRMKRVGMQASGLQGREVLEQRIENIGRFICSAEAAFAIMVQQRTDALLVIADSFFIARREQIVALAASRAMPAIYPNRWFPDCGGLVSYGAAVASPEGLYQQLGH